MELPKKFRVPNRFGSLSKRQYAYDADEMDYFLMKLKKYLIIHKRDNVAKRVLNKFFKGNFEISHVGGESVASSR